MNKIGINKCNNDNALILSNFVFNDFINVYDFDISQISSTIIENEIVKFEFLENIKMIKVIIKINVKIIYSKLNSNLLYVYEKNNFLVQYVDFPIYVDGINCKNLFSKNKVKINIFTENISSVLSDKTLLVNFMGVLKIDVYSSYYFAINLSSNLNDNIYIAYKNGSKLVQTSFELQNNFSDFKFSPDDVNLGFINYDQVNTSISIYNTKTKNTKIIKNKSVIKNVNSFVFVNKNILIICCENNGIFRYDLKNDFIENIYSDFSCEKYSNIVYNHKTKVAYFLCMINDKTIFCKLDKNKNFSILFNQVEVLDYTLDFSLSNALITTINNNTKEMLLYNIKANRFNNINIFIEYKDILKVKFYEFNKNKKIILLLLSTTNKKVLVLYNLNTMTSTITYEDLYIADFEIDETTHTIFVAISSENFSEIIEIKKDNQKKSSILKLPGNIKNIFIKKPYSIN